MNLGLLGAGHIAQALAEGWSRPGLQGAPQLLFYDVVAERAEGLAAVTGGAAAGSAAELVRRSHIVLVAVRPQHVENLLREIAPDLGGRPLVSVAAGVPLARLQAGLPAGSAVARVMPNGAAALGLGVFLLVGGTLGAEQREALEELLALAGTVVPLQEYLFDAATAVAGCMPGLLAAVVLRFAVAATNQGIAPDDAQRLAIEGVHGAAALIAREGDPAAVIRAAATPGGMTAAGVEALEAAGLPAAVDAAVRAATARAKELA
jgi:pyrroline-5-carboxylate reductase